MATCNALWAYIHICFAVAFASAFDPCDPENHTLRSDEWKRSANYKRASDESAICDRYIDDGWYRFDSSAGNDMPTTCVTAGRCGTTWPIWLKGTLPATNETITAEACLYNIFSNADPCCDRSYGIEIKNCNNEFNVYYLVGTDGCSQAYCFGTEVPCPDQAGFTPNCGSSTQSNDILTTATTTTATAYHSTTDLTTDSSTSSPATSWPQPFTTTTLSTSTAITVTPHTTSTSRHTTNSFSSTEFTTMSSVPSSMPRSPTSSIFSTSAASTLKSTTSDPLAMSTVTTVTPHTTSTSRPTTNSFSSAELTTKSSIPTSIGKTTATSIFSLSTTTTSKITTSDSLSTSSIMSSTLTSHRTRTSKSMTEYSTSHTTSSIMYRSPVSSTLSTPTVSTSTGRAATTLSASLTTHRHTGISINSTLVSTAVSFLNSKSTTMQSVTTTRVIPLQTSRLEMIIPLSIGAILLICSVIFFLRWRREEKTAPKSPEDPDSDRYQHLKTDRSEPQYQRPKEGPYEIPIYRQDTEHQYASMQDMNFNGHPEYFHQRRRVDSLQENSQNNNETLYEEIPCDSVINNWV